MIADVEVIAVLTWSSRPHLSAAIGIFALRFGWLANLLVQVGLFFALTVWNHYASRTQTNVAADSATNVEANEELE